MIRYIARRLGQAAVIVAIVAAITFALIHPKDVRRDYVLDSVLNRKRFEIPLAPRPIPAKELVRSIGSGMKELGVRAIRRIRRIFSTKVFGI